MNQDIKLYNQLMENINNSDNDVFYFKDEPYTAEYFYRLFNYRYATYSDFCLPDALEGRGIMFMMHREIYHNPNDIPHNQDPNITGRPTKCVSRPMEKFFNYMENPFTETIQESDIKNVYEKADGSLISTYIKPNGCWGFKSKMSLVSDQANAANELIFDDEYDHLRKYINQEMHYYENNLTFNFEYCAPDNSIVLHYEKPQLKFLNCRNNATGEYINHPVLEDMMYGIKKYPHRPTDNILNDTKELKDIEGFVCETHDGQRFKLKTQWYFDLHNLVTEIESDHKLYIACVNDNIDDISALLAHPSFVDHRESIQKRINTMMNFVATKRMDLNHRIVDVYYKYKHLSRKEFAISCKEEYSNDKEGLFGMTMQLYSGKEPDYTKILLKNWKGLYEQEFVG